MIFALAGPSRPGAAGRPRVGDRPAQPRGAGGGSAQKRGGVGGMLSKEDNERLTRVGPGTLMGDLMRQYWLPFMYSSELEPDGAPLRVRLLGEDLIVFRDTSGRVGLLDTYCAHRGASLFFGRNEECGIRCVYHG